MKVSPCFSARLFFRGIVPFFHPPLLGIRQLKFSFYLPCPDWREEGGKGLKNFDLAYRECSPGKRFYPPFPAFLQLLPSFFPSPPFCPFFFLTFFLRSSSLVRSFHRAETSLVARLRGFFPPAAAFRLFALLRVNRVATACKTDYALFQLFPLEILDKSLIDLYPLLSSCFRSRTRFTHAIVSRNFSREFFPFLFPFFLFFFESKRYLKRVTRKGESIDGAISFFSQRSNRV